MNTTPHTQDHDQTKRIHGWQRMLMAALGGIALLAGSQSVVQAKEKEQYVDSVITLLRLHANAIRQLATHDFKYSRNLARHATALQNTFGLLGPMEWHVSTSTTLQRSGGTGVTLKDEDFDKMADQCQKSMKGLYQASIQFVESGGSPEPVLKSLDELQHKCTACHTLLEGVAPDVWGTSKPGK
ncbi:MAG: cytochrome c [Magnetococcales bacterium]|nr:cytochrome c [Magnetococcales bacterium]NGZ05335.1 cytochrome c [Magnetococcales bacterium]